MQAVVIHAAGDLRVEDRPDPALGPRDVRVRVRAGGICGSDLHYFQHGGFGAVRLREPMILGHEIAGEVTEVGADATAARPGDHVAVNPSLPCGRCRYCLAGQPNHCLDMRFYGSAMRMPHVQGGFREWLACHESQAVRLPPGLAFSSAAFAEPLAVCLHAARQAGPMQGAGVLVSGAGPVGAGVGLVARPAGSKKSSKLDEAVRMWWSSAVSLPAASVPRRRVCRVGPRWPIGPYICARVGTSLTGRPTNRAAMQASTCGPEGTPFEPKPPPR